MVGILTHEKIKQRQKEIEVQALVALYLNTKIIEIKIKCEDRLFGIAFPEELAETIE